MPEKFDNFHSAYLECLRRVYGAPDFVNAPRGLESREKLGLQFQIADPRERAPNVPTRRVNLAYGFAKSLWYLAGRNDLGFIAYYSPGIRKFSKNGRTLLGTAYGRKIFHYGSNTIDQWSQVVKVLHEDRDSKRAVIQIFEANELGIEYNFDVACTLALQFLIREGKLYLVVFMRANDVFGEMVIDVFAFTFLQEFLACQLGLELGTYYHFVGSSHIYATDFSGVEEVLKSAESSRQTALTGSFPAMPLGDNWEYLMELLQYEENCRRNLSCLSADDLRASNLPTYWYQVAALLEVYREIHYCGRIDREVFELLPSLYQQLVNAHCGDYICWADTNRFLR